MVWLRFIPVFDHLKPTQALIKRKTGINMRLGLRFIPILMEETDKIMKAQMARGADFESGNLLKRAKSLVPLLIPLFISAFRIAQDLAMAMEARCYNGGENRTRMNAMRYSRRDLLAAGALILFVVLIVMERNLI